MMNLDIIFAKATCEVWKERLNAGECNLGEFKEAITKASQNTGEKSNG